MCEIDFMLANWAFDSLMYCLQDSVILHIDILDINDNSPEFIPNPSDSLLSYIKSIDEGPGSVGMVVIDVNATDKDYGTNAEIRYSMSGDENGYFKINSSTVCDWYIETSSNVG